MFCIILFQISICTISRNLLCVYMCPCTCRHRHCCRHCHFFEVCHCGVVYNQFKVTTTPQFKVHDNCTLHPLKCGLHVWYGLWKISTRVQRVSQLTKETVAFNNGGGENWGAQQCADIHQFKTIAAVLPTTSTSRNKTQQQCYQIEDGVIGLKRTKKSFDWDFFPGISCYGSRIDESHRWGIRLSTKIPYLPRASRCVQRLTFFQNTH